MVVGFSDVEAARRTTARRTRESHMYSVISISAPDEAVEPKLQSCNDKLFGHRSDFCGQMDLQLVGESKRGYTVSPSSRWIIVCMTANCQMSMNPYF